MTKLKSLIDFIIRHVHDKYIQNFVSWLSMKTVTRSHLYFSYGFKKNSFLKSLKVVYVDDLEMGGDPPVGPHALERSANPGEILTNQSPLYIWPELI